MRLKPKFLALSLLSFTLAMVLALVVLTDGSPRVEEAQPVTPGDVDRAVVAMRQLSVELTEPTGQPRQLSVLQRDLDLWVMYAVRKRLATTRAQVKLEPGRLLAIVSYPARIGRWLNLEIGLRQTQGVPVFDSLKLGKLPLPAQTILPLLRTFGPSIGLRVDAVLAIDNVIDSVRIAPGRLDLGYRVWPDTVSRVRAAIALPNDNGPRYQVYWERLAQLTQSAPAGEMSALRLLQPLFELARSRSAAPGADAAAENRAALLTLTLMANKRPIEWLIAEARAWQQPKFVDLSLNGRHDTALHFLISAAIASQADIELSNAVGLWKELADTAAGGSGFSFNDLAADRAGARFGDLAVKSPGPLQAGVVAIKGEAEFMPSTAELIEGLTREQFTAQYGGAEGEGYLRARVEIDNRISALALYQRPPL